MKTQRLFLFLFLFCANAVAEEPLCQPVNDSVEGLEIGEIKILNQDIFDLNNVNENAVIHKLANNLHWQTRVTTIKQQLLFQPGQKYNQHLINETERKLRSRNYLHAVSIYADKICDNKVIVVVNTSDNWTLTPSISYGRSGGINRSSIEISESNLLGLGKSIKFKSESDEDRDSQYIQYNDDNLLGSQYKLAVKTAENSDGYFDSITVGKPFFQLGSTESILLDTFRLKKQIAIYDNGIITDITGQETKGINLRYGWSSGIQNGQVIRYKLGWSLTDNTYFNVTDYPDSLLPEEKKLRFPYFGFEYQEDRYIQRENFNVMGVIEDVSIGNLLSAQIGLLNKSWGSSHDGYKISANYSSGFDINAITLGFIQLGLNSEVNQHAEDFNSLSFNWRLLHYQDSNHSYFLKAEYLVADNLLPNDQYVIGGDSGLRGYPIRFQTGHTKALLSVEKRSYFNWYPWKLVKFGVAIFADIGSAWEKNESANIISDVGIGIRLVSTRQSDSKVLHIDFAYPLDEQDKVDGFQLLLKAKSQF